MKHLLTLFVIFVSLAVNAKTIYFKNTANWQSVKAYTWDNNGNKQLGDWGGTAMQPVGDDDWWKINNDALVDGANIIFNGNNSPQTGNLTIPADCNAFVWDGIGEQKGYWTTYPPTIWTFCNDGTLVDEIWATDVKNNDFTKQADGSWQFVLEHKTLAAADYEYKAAKNRTWDVSLPAYGNNKLTINDYGTYTLTFTINAEETMLTADVLKEDSSTKFYIKHNWGGTGWSWKPLINNNDGTHYVIAQYGGGGCNVYTSMTEFEGWIENPSLPYGTPVVGDLCTFYYIESNNELQIIKGDFTGIDDVKVSGSKVVKMIEDGKVIIVKDGKKYNVMGQSIN